MAFPEVRSEAMTKTVMLDSAGGRMPLFAAQLQGSARGAVVVVQEAFGVNDHIEDVSQRFAAEGYRAVAPHLFHRSGDPVLDYSNIEKVMPHMAALTEADLLADFDATLSYLDAAGFESSSIGVVGFCMGGTVSFRAAVRYSLGGAVTFYGGGIQEGRFGMPSLIQLAPGLATPWLGLFGDLDQGIPVEEVEALREAARTASVPTEVVRYPDAEHGFHCDARPSYNEAAAKDAWQRTLDWFGQYLTPAG
jgi:carboxymethylenebutenolidase